MNISFKVEKRVKKQKQSNDSKKKYLQDNTIIIYQTKNIKKFMIDESNKIHYKVAHIPHNIE
ncbi:MAG: hypothetical protein DYG83_05300 [Candidatus Brocadia sp. AMX2]|nr:MAG: hypothetical protein EDM70_14255 [Candidatus Brocadia sp. AMX2]MBC6931532.1 hypothetical protein [Candidatus Brocadia sp.]MBL1169172.1 hypothetical protein [Candidatus Brocadia sp. AMX1]MCE7866239.1 hypothetical protein [Candidatus Brocadia sp. AMX2]MCQ3916708.1 hypothetical protein [Candidatus Brocadia sp.]